MLLLAVLALRGSLRAYLLWLGVLTFTVFSYVINAFSIPFGPLFLPGVAIVGLSLSALIGGVSAAHHTAVAKSFRSTRAVTVVAMAPPTNPVHVLDLGFFLPATIGIGALLLRRRPGAFTAGPAMLVFLVLTGIPFLLTPVLQTARGDRAARGIAAPIGTRTLALLGVLPRLPSTMQTPGPPTIE